MEIEELKKAHKLIGDAIVKVVDAEGELLVLACNLCKKIDGTDFNSETHPDLTPTWVAGRAMEKIEYAIVHQILETP